MNSLLKHQISKYLSNGTNSEKDLMAFIDAVNRAYDNFDEQYKMQQRAISVNSDELSESNEKLRQETLVQRNLIDKLNKLIESIRVQDESGSKKISPKDLDGVKLSEFIDKQTEELIEMNKQREQLMIELETQNEELSDYAYLVSHDLKSPLRTIDALSAWLKEDAAGNQKGNVSESLNLIRGNVEKMDNLISGILNYSTINKNQTTTYDLDLNEIINDILISVKIPEHIKVNLPSSLPIIKGDKFRVKQLFQNLIDNAIKYNNKEQGLLEIGFLEQPTHWKFYVKDNGIGIEKAYFDKIFKPFQKLENNSNATGIGLSIAKKIVSAFEGKIWLESEIGKGTVFYFTIKK
ncbi:phospho-acceptor domain-containing protein [Mariniflexile fucanivorans]|uniref:histidine kinase n=1 Tax=Mariniflexile fucanivorans TaxID=264023 RepID=A0A4R1RNZ2_9FLAO|nr:ATP-binding protein [Mariniflexile fucanivorans]TCL67944.1 phospho-acceptor domain-containing protein [Mariniflexile fucanivorans]